MDFAILAILLVATFIYGLHRYGWPRTTRSTA
jgi:hypothetical protein